MTVSTDRLLLDRLADVVGPQLITDPEILASYTTDWTGRFRGHTTAVVRPGSAAEVAGVVEACRERGAALVPQGGNTGLVGGGVPLLGEVVLHLGRLGAIESIDPATGQLTAGAGVVIADVERAANGVGWSYGVDLASRDGATVGGTVATNAGGVRMVRYGGTRDQVLGLEAVLGTGAVLSHLGGLVKDNTGYHLPGLVCGSEGTLAVVTAARLRLVPLLEARTTAILAFPAIEHALAAAAVLRRSITTLEAVELFLADGLDLVCSVTGSEPPFATPHAAYLLVEAADHADPTEALAEAASSVDQVAATVVATDTVRRAELWHYREAQTEAIGTLGVPHKLDVSLPHGAIAAFVQEVGVTVASIDPSARVWLFGHAGDGNVHVNVTGPVADDDRIDDAVFALVASFGGSISAEHGIGTAKKRWISLAREPAELDAFRRIKDALDPDRILNPNVLLPDRPPTVPTGLTGSAESPPRP